VKRVIDRIKGMFLTQELNLFKEFKRHVYLSKRGLELLIDAFESDLEKERELYKEIEKLEKEGDRLSNETTRLILDGAIVVSLQNYLITLMDTLDNILDTIHYLGGETYRRRHFEKLRNKDAIDMEKKILGYLRHSENSINQLMILFDNVISGDWGGVVSQVSRIESLEEEGDDIKHKLIDEIYSKWERIDEPYFSFLTHYIYEIDELQDLSEDASNIILIALQHVIT
jgi:predicted phosphate transport protein (TIGR00153 family)